MYCPRFHSFRVALIVCALSFVVSGWASAQGEPISAQRYGNSLLDVGEVITVDASDHRIVAGCIEGTVDFGGGPRVGDGLFLAKFDSAGVHLWSQVFTKSGSLSAQGVAVDGEGNIAITGTFSGSVNFGGEVLSTTTASLNIFFAKFDSDGDHLWSKSFGTSSFNIGRGVTFDSLGNVIFTGEFESTVDFDDGVGESLLSSVGGEDIFIVKYDASGDIVWSKSFGGGFNDTGLDVAVDRSDNLIVAGDFQETVDFGGGDRVSAGLTDVLLLKLDAMGNHIWSKSFGGTNSDSAVRVVIDDSENIGTTGTFLGTANLGGTPLTSAGGRDVFLAKYDSAGNHLWSMGFGGTGGDEGTSVAFDTAGDLSVSGHFFGAIDFGGGVLTSAGSSDIFLAEFDSAGNHIWSSRFGAGGLDQGLDIAIDSLNGMFFTGSFTGSVDFGAETLSSAGLRDVVIAGYDVTLPERVLDINVSSLDVSLEADSMLDHPFTVRNSGDGLMEYAIADDAGWLSVSPEDGHSSGELNAHTLSIDTLTLGLGSHSGNVTFTSPQASNSPQTVPVTLTVFPPPSFSVNLASVSQSIFEGTTAPSQSFEAWNSGGGTLSYSVTSDVGWLSVTPTSGSSTGAANPHNIFFNTSTLPVDVHDATITLTDTEDAGHFVTIPVSILVVEAASEASGSGGGGGGCFVATATYGTPMAEEVNALRTLRDSYLLNNAAGTAFVDTYYRVSPPVADAISRSPFARGLVRIILTPVLLICGGFLAMPSSTLTLVLMVGLTLGAGYRSVRVRSRFDR